MTEQAEKWTEALAKLTNRQDEQAEILRGIETTLTSRLNQQRGTSPLGEYHSQGELLKALVSDDTGKAEAAREAYNALLSRDYTGSVVADATRNPPGSPTASAFWSRNARSPRCSPISPCRRRE